MLNPVPWGNCDIDKVFIIVNNWTQGDIIADSEDDCVDDIHVIYDKCKRVRLNISSVIPGDQTIFPGVPLFGLSTTQTRVYLWDGSKLAR